MSIDIAAKTREEELIDMDKPLTDRERVLGMSAAYPDSVCDLTWAEVEELLASTPTRDSAREWTAAEVKAMAYELCLFRGDLPNLVDRGGVEKWEEYKPLAVAALKEASRIAALSSQQTTGGGNG